MFEFFHQYITVFDCLVILFYMSLVAVIIAYTFDHRLYDWFDALNDNVHILYFVNLGVLSGMLVLFGAASWEMRYVLYAGYTCTVGAIIGIGLFVWCIMGLGKIREFVQLRKYAARSR